jgi:hypothetical protein
MPPHIAKVKKLKPLRPKAGMFWLFCVGATSDRRRAASRLQRLAGVAQRQTKTGDATPVAELIGHEQGFTLST